MFVVFGFRALELSVDRFEKPGPGAPQRRCVRPEASEFAVEQDGKQVVWLGRADGVSLGPEPHQVAGHGGDHTQVIPGVHIEWPKQRVGLLGHGPKEVHLGLIALLTGRHDPGEQTVGLFAG